MSSEQLIVDPETRFACSGCGRCCSASWAIAVSAEKKDEILARPWAGLGVDPTTLVRPLAKGLWALTKQPGSTRCVMLGDNGLCELHRHWGAAAKPQMCVRFPYLAVASAEAVWVTANFGCKAVQEGHGPPLPSDAEDLARTFAPELAAVREDADIGYPISEGHVLGGSELDALVAELCGALDDGLFPGLATLAAFTANTSDWAPHAALVPPETVPQVSGDLRYALALTLYSDAVDSTRFWGRARGVIALPRMLTFSHRYTSRLVAVPIDMQAVFAHSGQVPGESQDLLLSWLRARLRGRQVLKDAPHFAAGTTRLMLQAAAVLYFARALATGRDITHADVLRALEGVELYIGNQQVVSTLAKLDPRLLRLWQDPAVAAGAAALFAPRTQA